MRIARTYNDVELADGQKFLDQRFQRTTYEIPSDVLDHVKSLLLTGTTVVMFSGSWRFDLEAIYLEAKIFQKTSLALHKNTWFVEPENTEFFNKVLQQLAPANLLILHSGFFCNYQPLEEIIDRAQSLQNLISAGSQLILTVPQCRVNFNRLKYSCEQIAQRLCVEHINDSFVVQRIKT